MFSRPEAEEMRNQKAGPSNNFYLLYERFFLVISTRGVIFTTSTRGFLSHLYERCETCKTGLTIEAPSKESNVN